MTCFSKSDNFLIRKPFYEPSSFATTSFVDLSNEASRIGQFAAINSRVGQEMAFVVSFLTLQLYFFAQKSGVVCFDRN